ncbi:MAG: hypothetical protein AABN33_16050 [Acidobacteriota bacterium]
MSTDTEEGQPKAAPNLLAHMRLAAKAPAERLVAQDRPVGQSILKFQI